MGGNDAELDVLAIRAELRRIIGEVIGADLSGVDDDGSLVDYITSLQLVEVFRQIYGRFAVLVPIRRVFEEQPTLRALSIFVDEELTNRVDEDGTAAGELGVQGRGESRDRIRVPLAAWQSHVGFLARYAAGAAAAYNEALLLKLEGALDHGLLQRALDLTAAHHDVLRAALSRDADMIEISPSGSVGIVFSECAFEQLDQRLSGIVARPFEVGEQLFRAILVRVSTSYHVLALVSHALLVDTRALEAIADELAWAYRGGAALRSAPPPLGWSASVELEDRERTSTARDAARAYFMRELAEGIPGLELPTDLPRPAIKSYEGARLVVPVDPGLGARIAAWAKAHGTTPFGVMFAGFAVLLHRITGQREIVIGAGREPERTGVRPQSIIRTERMVPVRSTYEAQRCFADQVAAEVSAFDQATSHDDLSLAELIQVLKLPRDQSRSPLFTVAFRAHSHGAPPTFDALRASFVVPPASGARYDLELVLATGSEDTRIYCDYATEIFEPATMARLIDGMFIWLRAGIADSAVTCARLPIMSDAEREALLGRASATPRTRPRDCTTFDLIAEQIARGPDRVAIRFQDQEVSYHQLGARIEMIATWLVDSGVHRGDRVGIVLDRSPDLIAAMLATWRIGAAYVPIDPAFPRQRISFVLHDADVRVTVTERKRAELVETRTLVIDESSRSGLVRHQASPCTVGDTAHIMYTSGSTGQPKGVELAHGGLLNLVLAARELLAFEAHHCFYAITTISFDISETELFVPLLAGGTVDIAEESVAADGALLVEQIEARKPTHVQATPSTWKAVLAAGWAGDKQLTLAACGEALERDLAEALLARCHTLWNFYGPTETTVYSLAYRVESAPGRRMRIGTPIANNEIYLLDDQLQPVPTGAVGELYIGGAGLARGYWRRPELTRERFIDHPFVPGKRLYRTGDLAFYLAGGDVVCLGRVDDQLKIHGVRVEPGEIEAALRDTPGVRDAVATAWKDPHGDAQLVAYVVPDAARVLVPSDVRMHLRKRLPDPMVPPYILVVDAVPRTANGKLHRAALPRPAPGGAARSIAFQEPATPTERLLAEAWTRVLKVDRIGRDDDFMDMGGHSLLMTELLLEVRKLFQVSFTLRELFGCSRLRELSGLIDQRRQARGTTGPAGTRPASRTRRTAEWARQRMVFLQREAQLPPSITPSRGASFTPASSRVHTALLTGASGFLGAYLLAELLTTSEASVYCLVRRRHREDAKQRIERQLQRYELWRGDDAWRDAWTRRVHVVEGDVTLPRLGISDAAYESLAREVDCIFHSAALVNFIYPYEALRATNVVGVHEIVRFAFHGRIKPLHYLSTAAIWPMGAQHTYYESDSIEHGGLLNLGYDEAKWVAERCLLHAADRGLPVARYRPGEVGGDSTTGRCVTDHFVIASVKGFLQLGAFPELDMYLDLTPADYVARVVVDLALRRNPLGHAFHLTNPRRLHMRDALAYLRRLGYAFDVVSFEDLRERLINGSQFGQNALFPYLTVLEDMDDVSLQLPNYDCTDTLRELEGSGIVCPAVDEDLLGTYYRYLRGVGFMPAPPGSM